MNTTANSTFNLLTLSTLILNTSFGVETCNFVPTIDVYSQTSRRNSIRVNYTLSEEKFIVFNHTDATLYLTCASSKPIEWVYSGEGYPSKGREKTERESAGIEPKGDSCTTSILFFDSSGILDDLESHTGKYTCRQIDNGTNIASVYIFFPAPVNKSEDFGSFLYHGKRKKTIVVEEESLEPFYLPCLTGEPNPNITLLKSMTKENETKSRYEALEPGRQGENYFYDNQKGFLIDPQQGNVFGTFKCRLNEKHSKNYLIFHVVKPPITETKFDPPGSTLFVVGSLNLTCEGEEPILIREVEAWVVEDYEDDYANDDAEQEEVFEETTEPTEAKIFIANHVDEKPMIGSTGTYQCVKEEDGKILHTWHYLIIDEETEKDAGLKHNATDMSFNCYTKTSSKGKLSYVNCETPSECAINGVCLQKKTMCRGYFKNPGIHCNRDKKCRKITHQHDVGIVKCKGEGIDAQIEFTNELDNYHEGFNSLLPQMGAKILLPDESDIYEGENIYVAVLYSRYLFVDGFKWAYKFKNESISFIKSEYSYLTGQGSTPSSHTATLNVQSINITHLIAFLPLRSSLEFFNISLPLLVKEATAPKLIGESQVNVTFNATEENKVQKLECLVEAMPDPEVIWYKDDKRLEFSSLNLELIESGQELILKKVSNETAGVYKCISSNIKGSVEKIFNLKVQ